MSCYSYGSCGYGVQRRYLTKEEKAKILDDYASELEQEAKAVRERITELQAK